MFAASRTGHTNPNSSRESARPRRSPRQQGKAERSKAEQVKARRANERERDFAFALSLSCLRLSRSLGSFLFAPFFVLLLPPGRAPCFALSRPAEPLRAIERESDVTRREERRRGEKREERRRRKQKRRRQKKKTSPLLPPPPLLQLPPTNQPTN